MQFKNILAVAAAGLAATASANLTGERTLFQEINTLFADFFQLATMPTSPATARRSSTRLASRPSRSALLMSPTAQRPLARLSPP